MERDNKRVGIINLQFTPNYGANIAAAVLKDITADILGESYEVNTVDYMPYRELKNKFLKYKDEIRQWGGIRLYLKQRFGKKKNTADLNYRNEKFDAFRKAFLNLTPRFTEAADINSHTDYRAFITGSDVVWAPKRTDNYRSEGYYLMFADKGERRIAYAPSIDHITNGRLKKYKNAYKDGLSHLDYISVRELESVDFLQSLTDKKVYQCADPVFLVDGDYYDKMISASDIEITEKYIYVYILELNPQAVAYANRLAREKGLKICYYSANHNDFNEGSESCIADGPADFLKRLKNAEYVITNSYHCICFSLIFKKQFLSFKRSGTSIKSTDLLHLFGLSSRAVVDGSECSMDTPVDFVNTERIRQELKNKSIQYLREALRDIG